MGALLADALSKTYQIRKETRAALRGVSFSLQAGERVAILGPSGAGKTTLLRILAGLEEPTSGRLEIDGKSLLGVPSHRRPIVLIMQGGGLFSHLSVFENLAFSLRSRGEKPVEISQQVEQMAALIGAEHLLGAPTSKLSGGQAQQVLVARALLAQPSVLLFDEPFAHLDPSLRGAVRAAVRKIIAAREQAAIFVTHDHDDAYAIAPRTIVLMDGSIAQDATPQEIYERPASLAVARFLGPIPMNVVDGAIFGRPGLRAAFRAERTRITQADAGIAAIVRSSYFAGEDNVISVSSDAGELTLRTAQPVHADERIGLEIDPRDLRWFDAISGAALP